MAGNVKYDDYVKQPHSEWEYTEQQIREVQRCKKSVNYFVRNYVKIVHQDKGVVTFEPYEYQVDLLDKFQKHRFNVCLLSRQSGKCLLGESNITVRNKETGEERTITMEEFYNEVNK